MKRVGDDVSFGCLCGHDLVLYSRLEKVGAFVIIRGPVDAAPGLLLVHTSRIHKHACYEVDKGEGKVTFTSQSTASLHNPGAFRVFVENINNLVSTARTSNLESGSGYI